VFTKPESPQLSPAQAQQLDDSFFGSRPFEYFSARIATLLATHPGPPPGTTELAAEFIGRLGVASVTGVLTFNKADRELQVATDGFALRHHAAEALVRLYHGLSVVPHTDDAPVCVWQSVADGPKTIKKLVDEARTHLTSQNGKDQFWARVLPADSAAESDERITALNVMGAWLQRAMTLLTRDDINLNAGNNKVKHGLAVRSRDDMRLSFTTVSPGSDGTLPLSAVTGPNAVDIIETVSLDYLAKPSGTGGRQHGLEMSTLRLHTPTLLAESWMMAVTYAAMFHIAARRHFAGREFAGPAYPALPLGPTPRQLLGDAVVGIRHPLTLPPDGIRPSRPAGIAFEEGFIELEIDIEGKSIATIVDG
jgi:hypothetical protein